VVQVVQVTVVAEALVLAVIVAVLAVLELHLQVFLRLFPGGPPEIAVMRVLAERQVIKASQALPVLSSVMARPQTPV
jgi:hypothetical protein